MRLSTENRRQTLSAADESVRSGAEAGGIVGASYCVTPRRKYASKPWTRYTGY